MGLCGDLNCNTIYIYGSHPADDYLHSFSGKTITLCANTNAFLMAEMSKFLFSQTIWVCGWNFLDKIEHFVCQYQNKRELSPGTLLNIGLLWRLLRQSSNCLNLYSTLMN